MKRIMVVMLVLSMFFAFCACSAEQKEMKTDIVGEWIAVSVDASAVFHEDGTGELQYNGKQSAMWKYDPDTDKYVVTGDQTYDAIVGKEYDMPYMSIMGIDFYQMDDYDKAYTLLLSRRLEDISIFTENMTKIELNKKYDLLNTVTIEFTEVTVHTSGNGLLVSYTVTNDRNEEVSEGLTSISKGKAYLADHNDAVALNASFPWAESIEAQGAISDMLPLMYHESILDTINRYGMVIGAVCFEFSGQYYYFNLSDWLK